MVIMPFSLKEIERSIIGEIWSSSESYENEVSLCNFGSRFGGTPSERKARDYILKKFKDYGLEARTEAFEYVGWTRGTAKFEIFDPLRASIPAISLVQSPSTAKEGLEGDLIFIEDGTPRDFQRLGDQLKGKIVMSTSKSPTTFPRYVHRREKYARSIRSGAIGYVFMNSQPGKLQQTGSLTTNGIGKIPAVSVAYEDGYYLQQLLKQEPLKVRMTLSNKTQSTTAWHVISEMPGNTYPENEILICGHYDGHDISQGAVDNGTGTAVIMELARVFGRHQGNLKRTIKFVTFPLEEIAITGSTLYLRDHPADVEKVDLVINLDSPGAPGRKGVCVQGYPEMIPYFQKIGKEVGYDIEVSAGVSHASDHFPFVTRGIPSVTLTTKSSGAEDRGWGHTSADTLDKVDPFDMKEATMVTAWILMRVVNGDQPVVRHKTEAEVMELMKRDDMEEILKLVGLWDYFFPWPKS
jgi:aminopeptidase YwaD